MGRRAKQDINDHELPPIRRAISEESRENQLLALAMNAAEKQLREGTASSQVIVHYLKLATKKEQLEQEMLARKTEHLTAQTESLQAAKRIEDLYENALKAMKEYGGGGPQDYDDEELY